MALIQLLFSAYSQAITSFFFFAVVLIAYLHIQHNAQLETSWLGILRNAQHVQLMNVMLYGIIVGLLASAVIVLLGIVVDYKAVLVIWPLAILLMLFNLRFVSFAYAGAVVCLASMLFGWPEIDVSALVAFIAILHLAESVLIYLDGFRDSIPVLMEYKQFKPVGAYVMKKLWPVPLVILVSPEQWMVTGAGGVGMPDWWPVFRSQADATGVLMLFPIVVALSYSDITSVQLPRERTRESGFWMGVYSLIILIIATISSRIYWMKYVAVISMPVLHELLIAMARKLQIREQPAFGAPWRGLRVLEVLPESVGEKMGIRPGDILMSLNGKQVNSQIKLEDILSEYPTFIWAKVERKGEIKELEWRDYQEGINELGVIFVPRQTGQFFIPEENRGIFFQLLRKIRKS